METMPNSASGVPSASPTPVNQPPLPMPPAPPSDGRKRMMIIVGIVVVVIIGVIAALFGGGVFKGSFLSTESGKLIIVTMDKATKTSTGDVVLTYTMKNTDTKDVSEKALLLQKITTDTATAPIFVRPWNYTRTVSLRAGESLAYTTTLPKDTVGAAKQLSIKLYEQDVDKKETELSSSNAVDIK